MISLNVRSSMLEGEQARDQNEKIRTADKIGVVGNDQSERSRADVGQDRVQTTSAKDTHRAKKPTAPRRAGKR